MSKSNNFLKKEVFKKENLGVPFIIIAIFVGGDVGGVIGAGLSAGMMYGIFWVIYRVTGQKLLPQLKPI